MMAAETSTPPEPLSPISDHGDTMAVEAVAVCASPTGNDLSSHDGFPELSPSTCEVLAPPGKLGITFGTYESGGTFVQSVKDDSPLVGNVQTYPSVPKIEGEGLGLVTQNSLSVSLNTPLTPHPNFRAV